MANSQSDSQSKVTHNELFAHPANFLALGFGAGLAPFAPGTVGSLVALPMFLAMPKVNIFFYIGIVVLLFLIGLWCCSVSADLLGVHDHPAIVWDEIVGMLIALFMVPPSLVYVLLAFLLFRFFDILKPWPIGWVDRRVDRGMGIMMDDVLAGVMAWLTCQGVYRYLVPLITG